MNVGPIESLAALRTLVGFLGEREQFAWWPSAFFAPGSQAFLLPLFARTRLLAQCNGVTQAAALVHDDRIGVGQVYHLFRLPEDMEQAIHRFLNDEAACGRLEAQVGRCWPAWRATTMPSSWSPTWRRCTPTCASAPSRASFTAASTCPRSSSTPASAPARRG
jgi:hypothetical protein